MKENEIERFKETFYAEGVVRRRRKKKTGGRGGHDQEYRKSQKQRDQQRKADRDEVSPSDADVKARNEAALEEERLDQIRQQEARDVKLAAMNDEISALGDTEVAIRHKSPSGIPTGDVLIDKWKELETKGLATSSEWDEDLDDLRDEIDSIKYWLDEMEAMFDSARQAEALYDYAVRNRPIDKWPTVTDAAKVVQDAIKWPYPDKAAYLAGLDVIRTAKQAGDAAKVNVKALKGSWKATRDKVEIVRSKVDEDTVRIKNIPAVDATFSKLDKLLGTKMTADLLEADFLAGLTDDIQRLDDWADVVVDKVDGKFFQFLEQAISQIQPKKEVKPWDFESERAILMQLLFETPVVSGGQIQAGFDAMLKKFGPWTSAQKLADAEKEADAERVQLSLHFSGTWGLSKDDADASAKKYYAVNSKALEALKRNTLALATLNLLVIALKNEDAALKFLLGLPENGANTVQLARCLSNQQINDTNVWVRIQAGDAMIEYTGFFPYQGTAIEVELTVKWAAVGMPGRVEWCVVHIHYHGIVANAAGFHFAHLKEWTARQAGSSSNGSPGNALVNHVKGIVHPKGLTL